MKSIVNKVSIITIIVNIILALFKCTVGIIANSSAMISDSVHSASDVLSTIVVMAGVHMSSKDADEEHPYGHERIECIAGLILAISLMVTGLTIGVNAFDSIISGKYSNEIPGKLALVAAIISIITKELMYWYTKIYANKIKSSALLADAWHHRSDAMSSVGALIGILFAINGFPIMDSVAGLVITGFITKISIDIFKDSMNKLIDRACDRNTEKEILKLSDLYHIPESEPMLELKVLMLNINDGNNEDLKESCQLLKEYMIYVNKVRKYAYQEKLPLNEAVELAVTECIKEGILEDFLRNNRAEVVAMSIFEFNEERELQLIREEEYQIGLEEGLKQGEINGESRLGKLIASLINAGRSSDVELAAKDENAREKFYKEFNIE